MKPKIFISSTIYDFKDIRSSLKYFLEQYEYDVQLSEYNDFKKELDLNSYMACLETIKNVDYFILFIGSRIGGYFNKKSNLSITRKEYQTAYDAANKNKLKLLIFVRDEIWNIKEDRKALEKYLKSDFSSQNELSDKEIKKITTHKSSFINDAINVFSFLDEVARKSEMIDAINGKGEFPKNNWIHPFKSFSEIIDVIKNVLKLNSPLKELSLRHNLLRELSLNIQSGLLKRRNGELYEFYNLAKSCRSSISKNFDDPSMLRYGNLQALQAFAIYMTGQRYKITKYFTEEAISSGYYLQFNSELGSYEDTIISKHLHILHKRITELYNFEKFSSENFIKFMQKFDHLKGSPDDQKVTVDNIDIITYMVLFDCFKDIMSISKAIYKALKGDLTSLENIKLSPVAPFENHKINVTKDNPTISETLDWIEGS